VALAVGLRLKRLLERRGARVVLTRALNSEVPLDERSAIARKADAHAFVSIHVDALPDGANPFERNGTATHFLRPHSEALAGTVQRGMLTRMGLSDRGVTRSNFAVLRSTWMPAVLCEGAVIILPEQEAMLRDEKFQEAYAKGIADGLEEYFNTLRKRRIG
jgi:N-acetylmuramoyl-L-alanine amidase